MNATHNAPQPISRTSSTTGAALSMSLLCLLAITATADDYMTDSTRFAGAPAHTVYFDFAADRVSADELSRLDAVIEPLKGTAQPLQIRGFTDAIGFQAYNDDLALRRADSVRAALLQRGIPASRIRTGGVGRVEYVGDNHQEATRKLNRRVEIRFEERRLRAVETGPRRRDGDDTISKVGDPRRVGRYSELTAVPSPGQANPLKTVISVTFPQDITTVGAALNHVLARSGWQVASHEAGDPTFNRLATLPLPAAQRALGPIALIDALSVLCGEAYTVVVDPVHRLISCELREPYTHLVRFDHDLMPTQGAPNGDEPDGQH